MQNISFTSLFQLIIIGSLTFFLAACTHKSPEIPADREISYTKLPDGKAPLLDYLDKTDERLAGNSAFYSLFSPTDALAARLFLIDHATTSLDVQYYIYKADTTGQVFAAHLLLAAHRGVKVRILMDDLSTTGKDENWQRLASHPNIELRLFNPNTFRTSFRNLALLFNVNSLGKRMHNKSLIADGAAAIIGGRNIGDVYFASNAKTLFLDYDVLAIGKVVPDIYRSFDVYWNSQQAVPAEDVLDYDEERSYHPSIEDAREGIELFEKSAAGKAITDSDFNRKSAQKELRLIVARQTDFYYDHPSKVTTDEKETRTHISTQISEDLREVDHDLTVISPYFIPSEEMMARFKALRAKGVEVTVITNSLASTDVFAVYSGYQWYIKELIEMGVRLYELKPSSFKKHLTKQDWADADSLSLHTKMILIDDIRVAVGSANIDPRSDKLNTEILMIIESKKLTEAVRAELAKVLDLQNFYRLSWGVYPTQSDDEIAHYGPIWSSIEEGEKKEYYHPPHVGFWKTFGTNIISLLPIKGYL